MMPVRHQWPYNVEVLLSPHSSKQIRKAAKMNVYVFRYSTHFIFSSVLVKDSSLAVAALDKAPTRGQQFLDLGAKVEMYNH